MSLRLFLVTLFLITLHGCGGGDTASTGTSSSSGTANTQSQMGTATLGTARLQ